MDDLDKVSNRFNKWSDKNQKGYSAWTITPQFRTSDQPFHMGWIGAWADDASSEDAYAAHKAASDFMISKGWNVCCLVAMACSGCR